MHRTAHPVMRFRLGVLGAVTLGAIVRLAYLLTDERPLVGGDGFTYHLEAHRLADGLGYTAALGEVGAQTAHHPPGWVTVLGGFSWLGGRTLLSHQLFTSAIGLVLIVLAALVGRRYFSSTVGVLAALLAAVYPGFWVLEGQVLSEPLGLVLLALLTLGVADLRDRPSLARSVLVGTLCGLLALVRAEQLVLLVLVVAPILYRSRDGDPRRRLAWFAGAALATSAVIAPWAIYNSTRFDAPVVLSTTVGRLLLIGNCPSTFDGELLGYFDASCVGPVRDAHAGPGVDRSELDADYRRAALEHLEEHAGRLPIVVPARVGRAVAVFRPSQTVGLVSSWMKIGTAPVWGWVVGFWALLPLAVLGAVQAQRSGSWQLPLLAPIVLALAIVVVAYGEPRYHTPADLGVVVLAAVGLTSLVRRP